MHHTAIARQLYLSWFLRDGLDMPAKQLVTKVGHGTGLEI
jgi:hypothetical protein